MQASFARRVHTVSLIADDSAGLQTSLAVLGPLKNIQHVVIQFPSERRARPVPAVSIPFPPDKVWRSLTLNGAVPWNILGRPLPRMAKGQYVTSPWHT